jgi:NAD(P)-dependent dehydrogenase (short-subunit alcohol dehydrogenase family)
MLPIPNIFSVEKQVVCITGSSRGLGKTLARAFAEHGAKVVLTSFNKPELDQTYTEFKAAGLDVAAIPCDVANSKDCEHLIQTTVATFGWIDSIICNAGTDIIKPATEYDDEEWDKILNVNLRGVYMCAKYAAIAMIAQKSGGTIIMTSSIASHFGIAGLAPYASSKGAVNQLVKTMAVEFMPHNIRVNAIAPGYLNNIMDGVAYDPNDPYQKRIIARTLMGRRGNLDEFIGAYIFLASNASSYVTGQIIGVDGGYSCW